MYICHILKPIFSVSLSRLLPTPMFNDVTTTTPEKDKRTQILSKKGSHHQCVRNVAIGHRPARLCQAGKEWWRRPCRKGCQKDVTQILRSLNTPRVLRYTPTEKYFIDISLDVFMCRGMENAFLVKLENVIASDQCVVRAKSSYAFSLARTSEWKCIASFGASQQYGDNQH